MFASLTAPARLFFPCPTASLPTCSLQAKGGSGIFRKRKIFRSPRKRGFRPPLRVSVRLRYRDGEHQGRASRGFDRLRRIEQGTIH